MLENDDRSAGHTVVCSSLSSALSSRILSPSLDARERERTRDNDDDDEANPHTHSKPKSVHVRSGETKETTKEETHKHKQGQFRSCGKNGRSDERESCKRHVYALRMVLSE